MKWNTKEFCRIVHNFLIFMCCVFPFVVVILGATPFIGNDDVIAFGLLWGFFSVPIGFFVVHFFFYNIITSIWDYEKDDLGFGIFL